jgi:hypothetical protein
MMSRLLLAFLISVISHSSFSQRAGVITATSETVASPAVIITPNGLLIPLIETPLSNDSTSDDLVRPVIPDSSSIGDFAGCSTLAKAIQEQHQMIDELKKENEELKKINASQKNLNQYLLDRLDALEIVFSIKNKLY